MAATGGALPRDHSGGVKSNETLPALRCGPLWMHTCVDGGAAVAASLAVSPFILIIDRAVIEAAAGQDTLFRRIGFGCKEMILKPRTALMTRAYAMMTGVYAATYLAANTIDTVATRQRYSQKTHVAATLIGTTAVNASACIAKDVAFAKMYGGSGAGKKAMPFASYGLFLSRDLITIFSSFTLPKMLAKGISSSGAMDPVSAQACAQMVSPVAMQGVCAPVHLLALNMYNAPVASVAERIRDVWRVAPATVVAFGIRMAPAFGIGGIMNAALVDAGHAAVCRSAPGEAPAGPP